MKKTVLLTGTSGFVGGLIKKHLLSKGSYDVLEVAGRKGFESKVQEQFLKPVDLVIHAGFDVDYAPFKSEDNDNVRNTRFLVDMAKKHQVEHFIFLSGAAVLGVSKLQNERTEEHLGQTDASFEGYYNSQYVQDKLICEKALETLGKSLSILYLTTVYGPKDKCEIKNSFLKLRGANPLVVCPPGGTSFLDYRDFLAALDQVLTQGPVGRLVISSGNLPFREVFHQAAKQLGVRGRKFILPLPGAALGLIRVIAGVGKGKILSIGVIESTFGYKYYSFAKAQKHINWQPRHTIDESINMLIEIQAK